MENINWTSAGVIVTAAIACIGLNGYVMKMVIDNAVTKLHLVIREDYVTKAEFDKHIEGCPVR